MMSTAQIIRFPGTVQAAWALVVRIHANYTAGRKDEARRLLPELHAMFDGMSPRELERFEKLK